MAMRQQNVHPGIFLGVCLALALSQPLQVRADDENVSTTMLDEMIQLDTPRAKGIMLTPDKTPEVASLKAGLTENMTMLGPDRRNMELLWQALVQKNPVIQYSLKQLATPPELRYAQESIFSRTVGTLLTGASMVPFVFGADPYATGATSIGANMVDRAMHQSSKGDLESLPSDTELVELSGTVQKLRETLITRYSDYVSHLRKAASLREQADVLTLKLQAGNTDPTTRFTLNFLRETLEQQSTESLESAKCEYIALERLVGVDTMKKIQLAQAETEASSPEGGGSITTMQPVVEPTPKGSP